LLVCLLVLLPQRMCLCAGEVVPCNDRNCAVALPENPPPVAPAKCCGHHHDAEEAIGEVASSEPATHRHEHHDSECPAVNASAIIDTIKPAVDMQYFDLVQTATVDSFELVVVNKFLRLPTAVVSALDPPLYLILRNWRN